MWKWETQEKTDFGEIGQIGTFSAKSAKPGGLQQY
jgi:hypothetical protein